MSGFVHVYTGNGKGKTTAALGMALRAAGAGWKVFIARFGSAITSSELTALDRFADLITVKCYVPGRNATEESATATSISIEQGLIECKDVLASGEHSLVILDEVNVGPMLRFFPVAEILGLIDSRADSVELVITGRYAHHSVINRADLVTEMREVKHYYHRGISARTGIEQ
jgi:cob(I)alamin adenosyltransferase